MTLYRIFFTAHNRDPILGDAILQPFDSSQESMGLSDAGIQDMPFFVVELRTFGSATKLPPKVEVLDLSRRKDVFQVPGIKVRRDFRIRVRPYVHEHIDTVLE